VSTSVAVKLVDLAGGGNVPSGTPSLWGKLAILQTLDKNLDKLEAANIPSDLCALSAETWRHTLLLKSGALKAVSEMVTTACNSEAKMRRRLSLGPTSLAPSNSPTPGTPFATLEHCAKTLRNFAAGGAKLVAQQLIDTSCVTALLAIVKYMETKSTKRTMPQHQRGIIQFNISGAFNAMASNRHCRNQIVNLMVVPTIVDLARDGDLPTKSQCAMALAKFSCDPRNIARMTRQDAPKAFVNLFRSEVPQVMHIAIAGLANFIRENEYFENQTSKAIFQNRYLNLLNAGMAEVMCRRWPGQDLSCLMSTTFCLASISTDERCHSKLVQLLVVEHAVDLMLSPPSPVGKHATREETRYMSMVAEQCAILLTNLARTLQASISERVNFRQCVHEMAQHDLSQVRECASLIFGHVSSSAASSTDEATTSQNASKKFMRQKHAIADLEGAVNLFLAAEEGRDTSLKVEDAAKVGLQKRSAALSILNMITTDSSLHKSLCSSKETFSSILAVAAKEDGEKLAEDCVEILVVLAASSTLKPASFVFMIECQIVELASQLCARDNTSRCKGVDIILSMSEHEAIRNNLVDAGAIKTLRKATTKFSAKDVYQMKCARLAYHLSLSDRQESLVAQGMVQVSTGMVSSAFGSMPMQIEVATFAVKCLANLSFNKECREALLGDMRPMTAAATLPAPTSPNPELPTSQDTEPSSLVKSSSRPTSPVAVTGVSILSFLVKVGLETSSEDFSTLQSVAFAAKNLSYVNGKEGFIVQEGLVYVLVRSIRLFPHSSAVCKYVAIAMANLSTNVGAARQVK
jgi:hypothetical protein